MPPVPNTSNQPATELAPETALPPSSPDGPLEVAEGLPGILQPPLETGSIPLFDADPNAAIAATILVVDSEEINRRLLKAIFKTTSYTILEARKASEATALLQSEKIDLVILDLMLPEMSGPELCRWMKAQRKTQLIPVLMITNILGVENEIAGISSGADEFLIKPLHPTVVRTRVRAMLRNKTLIDTLDEAETILMTLAQIVERRDPYTGKHCQRLSVASVMLGEALGLPSQDLTSLYRGGFLHDIGKIGIPDSILFKRGRLTAEEWDVMRSHPVRGEEICRAMRSLWPVLPIIRGHHERWDGSGYPDGLAGEDIPLLARILQVADIYDALTTERPYKLALAPEAAFAVMEEEVRRGWRDPELVPLFASTIQTHPTADLTSLEASLANMRLAVSR
jgi:putative two-component system response regulator